MFEERGRVHEGRRRERAARRAGTWRGPGEGEARAWAEEMLAEAARHSDMPGLRLPDDVLMPETAQSNLAICFPQVKNLDGKIFGGFLMRYGFEVAWSTCHLFAGSRPFFVEVDEISFRKPVNIGDLIRFQSVVLHSAVLPGGR